jgi:hypothetical protein
MPAQSVPKPSVPGVDAPTLHEPRLVKLKFDAFLTIYLAQIRDDFLFSFLAEAMHEFATSSAREHRFGLQIAIHSHRG